MTHQTDTLAGNKSIGFDYQFYYFFYLLLGMRHGDTVGLEVKDDIHIDLKDGKLQLIQAKHSIQTDSEDETVALTNLDIDLWKTLFNWAVVISEQADPQRFTENTQFILVSNKNLRKNATLNKVALVRKGEVSVKDFKKYLGELHDKTDSITIKGYIKAVKNLNSPNLKSFLGQLEFTLKMDNLINKIHERLLEKIHIKERIKTVYDSLNSELRDAIYNDIKAGKRIEFSFESFTTRFGKCFKSALSTKLPIREFDILLPTDPKDQKFIKQLIDIGDIRPDENDSIIQFTTQMLTLYNQLKDWESNGDLLPSETSSFDKNSILMWKNSFKSKYRNIRNLIEAGTDINSVEPEISTVALDCLDEMRKAILTIDDNILSTELSNGHFYLLTEKKQLGWHYDWENKY